MRVPSNIEKVTVASPGTRSTASGMRKFTRALAGTGGSRFSSFQDSGPKIPIAWRGTARWRSVRMKRWQK